MSNAVGYNDDPDDFYWSDVMRAVRQTIADLEERIVELEEALENGYRKPA